jgi:hypothetical protein
VAKAFLENIRSPAGFAGGYVALVESDFAAAAGGAYVPPERGAYRRVVEARTIQLLQDSPLVAEAFQLSAAVLRLPSNQIGNDETGNDAGDGRIFLLKNSGTGNISLQKSTGDLVGLMPPGSLWLVVSNDNQQWDVANLNNATNGLRFSRSGNVPVSAYLLIGGIPSNISGGICGLLSGILSIVTVSVKNAGNFKFDIQRRSGVSFTTIGTVTLSASRVGVFALSPVNVSAGDEFAVRVSADSLGSPEEPIVEILPAGALP